MRLMLSLLFGTLKKKRSLEDSITKIQSGDVQLREELIVSFKPFIAKTVSSVCKRYINDSDDEFSIGLIAFNEAIDKYSTEKGSSLLAFAETLIRRRVIDYLRSQSRKQVILMDLQNDDDEDQTQSFLESEKSLQEYHKEMDAQKRREEILLYQEELKEFDVKFSDLVELSPKHSDARKSAILIANTLAQDPDLMKILYEKKRLPIKTLEEKVSVSRKTIERNRKYIIAIAIIISGPYTYLKDYIKGVLDE
ncbi:RNA polymerase sigma factor SigI [Peribacillus tepidiphilus]|uniref:RNA polymerase sigma factor SigI n=1 Tax=Peribacillus tepidiphilus TaxID=2652445 RepID=UPI0035B511F7